MSPAVKESTVSSKSHGRRVSFGSSYATSLAATSTQSPVVLGITRSAKNRVNQSPFRVQFSPDFGSDVTESLRHLHSALQTAHLTTAQAEQLVLSVSHMVIAAPAAAGGSVYSSLAPYITPTHARRSVGSRASSVAPTPSEEDKEAVAAATWRDAGPDVPASDAGNQQEMAGIVQTTSTPKMDARCAREDESHYRKGEFLGDSLDAEEINCVVACE